jgi:nucleoid-associated protein YejK
MELTRAVVHYLNKTRDVEEKNIPSTLRLRQALLPINDKLTNLIRTLRQLYNNKSGHGYGVFHENQDAYPFSARLAGHGSVNWDFLDFTHRAMALLKIY